MDAPLMLKVNDMVKEYMNGHDFLVENEAFLNTDERLSAMIKTDAAYITSPDKRSYALRVTSGGGTLLALKLHPFPLLPFGDSECVPELLNYIDLCRLEAESFLCESGLGEAMSRAIYERHGLHCVETLAMDLMAADEVSEPTCPDVCRASAEDAEEICDCVDRFLIDCGLTETQDREATKAAIGTFRILRENGVIVSMAQMPVTELPEVRIRAVYTRDECRGRGCARKVVNAVKNEILSMGKLATLNVDKKNPISNRLYLSLGFKRVLSQSEYRVASLDGEREN